MDQTYTEKDYPEKLVAFVDILGFQRMISQDPPQAVATINIIDGHLQHVLDVLEREYEKVFSVKLFSDCMCVSCEHSIENLFFIIFELAFIQYYLFREGILLRGALSCGPHFENNRMIFSQGLVSAYQLEGIAIYPRIVLDKKLVDVVLNDKNYYIPVYAGECTKDFVIQSPDGHYFIDYLHIMHQDSFDRVEELELHKKSIEKAVKLDSLDSKIMDKIRWLAEYHNSKVQRVVSEDGYEEPDLSEVLNSTLINISDNFSTFRKINERI